MKKYIFTEGQVKKILDNVVEEKLVTEQTSELNFKKAVQCFLNKTMGAKLKVDGLHGDGTRKAIENFQSKKKLYPVDGVWGPNTASKLTDKEVKIMKSCRSEHGDIIDKFLNWLGIG
ncbi:peptidoglycan-binding protein [bacterium]|jgi:peptidoglycan hydrolase-like protein with peptidoglycan-binding domain|nr:peptidoglycan-binding protein [bacterium]